MKNKINHIREVPELKMFLNYNFKKILKNCVNIKHRMLVEYLEKRIHTMSLITWIDVSNDMIIRTMSGMKNTHENHLFNNNLSEIISMAFFYMDWISGYCDEELDDLLIETGVKRC